MLKKKTIELFGPSKGDAKNVPFAKYDPDFALDALNVVPFDQEYRRRVSQRTGITTQSALASNWPVQMLRQATIVPQVGTFGTGFTLNDFTRSTGGLQTLKSWNNAGGTGDLSYINGTLIKNTGDWLVSNLSNNDATTLGAAFNGNSTTLSWVKAGTYSSSYAGQGGFFNNDINTGAAMQLIAPLPLGLAYVIACRVTGSSGSPKAQVFIRRNDADGANSISVIANRNSGNLKLTIQKNDGTAALASTTFSGYDVGLDFMFYVAVLGDVIYATAHKLVSPFDYQSINVTTTVGSNYTGIGLMFSNDANSRISQFTVNTQGGNAARSTKLVGIAQGNVYTGTPGSMNLATGGGRGVAESATTVQGAVVGTAMYIADGHGLKKLDLATDTLTTVTASAGTIPPKVTLACLYRGRLVVGGAWDDSQNIYASKVGDPTNFDFAPATPSVADAWAGNTGNGRIPGPVVALVPLSDDLLLIAGDNYMAVMRGDIGDGGSIDTISDAVGLYGPESWTKAPDGSVYFVGSGGFYKISGAGTPPEPISARLWDEYFVKIDRGNRYIHLAWDRDRQGCMIFLSSKSTTECGDAHLWFDAKTETFWPQVFGDANATPIRCPSASVVYDGDGRDDRFIVMGGKDGSLRTWDRTAKTDDEQTISSYLTIGPVRVGDGTSQSTLESYDVSLGSDDGTYTDADFNVNLEVVAANNEEELTKTGVTRYARSTTHTQARRNARRILRTTGNAFAFRFSNAVAGKGWSLERLTATFIPGGRVRRH